MAKAIGSEFSRFASLSSRRDCLTPVKITWLEIKNYVPLLSRSIRARSKDKAEQYEQMSLAIDNKVKETEPGMLIHAQTKASESDQLGAKTMLRKEFGRQVENLLQKGYPEAAGISAEEFLKHIDPLKERVGEAVLPEIDLEKGYLPFVIVVKSALATTEKAMSLVEREGKQGFTKMYPRQPKDFETIEGVSIPNGMAYLLLDIDRGKETINLIPSEALKIITKQNRSPLTIDEGVAIVTHYPEFLIKNNCFSLLASRYRGDKRVPAIWINRERKANLGWCWEGNPHTWLGSASCGSRFGP